MAKDLSQAPSAAPAEAPEQPVKAGKTPFLTKKIILLGIPIFLVQLVVLYFIVGHFLMPPADVAAGSTHAAAPTENPEVQNVFVVKDIIVNPAGTNGTRFLLLTVGFETTTPESVKELERKELQVRDVLNSILTAKELSSLADASERESLRKEIATKISPLVHAGTIKGVLFSKFIIQ